MSNKVNRKAPTEAQKKKKDPLAKKRNAAKILALILAGYGAWYGSSSTFMAGVKRFCKRQSEMGNGSRRGTV